MVVAQPVSAPLTRAAIFLVVMINPGPENRAAVRSFCADVGGLIRAVEFRDLEAGLSCVIGIGSGAWDRLFGNPRPAELHPFREVRAGPRHAVSTRICECLLLAQSGHPDALNQCPLSGAKRTSTDRYEMSTSDPMQTSTEPRT